MIVKSVKAWNFMRFHYLEIKNLPERGLFTVQGPNESGKSTIGHLLYLALSGRTPRGYESAPELINWEKGQFKIELSLQIKHKTYELNRQCDRDGSVFTMLTCEGETLAQGNKEVAEKFKQLLGYSPEYMHQSFCITHQAIIDIGASTPVRHLEKMLGLEKISRLNAESQKKIKELENALQNLQGKVGRIQEESESVGYKPEDEDAANKTAEELQDRAKSLEAELKQAGEDLNQFQSLHTRIEQEQKSLTARIDSGSNDELFEDCRMVSERCASIEMGDKAAQLFDKFKSSMSNVLDYQKAIKKLSEDFQGHLSQIRDQLGLSDGNDQSLKKRIEKSSRGIQWQNSVNRFFGSCVLLIILGVICGAVAYVERKAILAWMRGSEFLRELADGDLREPWQKFLVIFEPGIKGIPVTMEAYLIIMAVLLVAFIAFIFYVKGKLKLGHANKSHGELLKEQEKAQKEYNQLLGVDFNDMKESVEMISSCSYQNLKDTFKSFESENQFLVEREYDLKSAVRILRSQLEEVGQAISLKVHQGKENQQSLEEKVAACQNEIVKHEPVLKDIQEKKEKFLELGKETKDIVYEQELKKKDHRLFSYLQELAEGCHNSTLSRLRFDFTAIYKTLLPKTTGDRYASIRLDENFTLQVFSEERGDFVSLEQLSSGTHDLMMLLFQLILVEGFMESRNVDDHFLFMDEPLLAVDSKRYQRLCDIILDFSPRLNQIFLCRPPSDIQGYHSIHTTLDQKELVVDFASS